MIEEWEEDEWPPDEEKAELRAELEALRSRWDAIPWELLEWLRMCAGGAARDMEALEAFDLWLDANAPKEQP